MKILEKFLFIVVSLSVSQLAYSACAQNNNSLGLVGLDSPDATVYAKLDSSTNECSCPDARFRSQNTDTKMALSVLMSAKMANKKVRVDYLDQNDCNSAYRVYVH